jgi:hypothetical protein
MLSLTTLTPSRNTHPYATVSITPFITLTTFCDEAPFTARPDRNPSSPHLLRVAPHLWWKAPPKSPQPTTDPAVRPLAM